MSSLVQMVEKELKIPREQLVEEGVKQFLEMELRNLSIQIKKVAGRHEVSSFDELWRKLETGKVAESECLDDLTKLEYLELEKKKIAKLLRKAVKE